MARNFKFISTDRRFEDKSGSSYESVIAMLVDQIEFADAADFVCVDFTEIDDAVNEALKAQYGDFGDRIEYKGVEIGFMP